MVLGANIGTSVTNTIVAITQVPYYHRYATLSNIYLTLITEKS
jgi:Na+/phosphate symporter